MEIPFFSGLSKLKLDIGKFRKDDDQADRFNHIFTTIILICFSIVVSTRQYIGKPIACWVPSEFTSSQEEYAESICWVTSTYFVNPRTRVPDLFINRDNKKILYYQWVPFILMIQAIMFSLPCLLWRFLNWQSGISLNTMIEVIGDVNNLSDPEIRKSNINYVSTHIDDSIHIKKEYRNGCLTQIKHCLAQTCCLWFGKRYGNYLICIYMICKSLYILNILSQFFILNSFLGANHTFYGFNLIRQLTLGIQWSESGNFPRITMCDFVIRKLANQHRYTVQCVLPLNMFNEKIFIFLWFWYMFVGLLSIHSFIDWIYKSIFHNQRYLFIRKYLILRDSLRDAGDRKKMHAFIDLFLQHDGIFIIRMIALNCGNLIAAELTENLWLKFKDSSKCDTLIRYSSFEKNSSELLGVGGSSNITNRFNRFKYNNNNHHHQQQRDKKILPAIPINKTSNSGTNTISSRSNNSSNNRITTPTANNNRKKSHNRSKTNSDDPGEFV